MHSSIIAYLDLICWGWSTRCFAEPQNSLLFHKWQMKPTKAVKDVTMLEDGYQKQTKPVWESNNADQRSRWPVGCAGSGLNRLRWYALVKAQQGCSHSKTHAQSSFRYFSNTLCPVCSCGEYWPKVQPRRKSGNYSRCSVTQSEQGFENR